MSYINKKTGVDECHIRKDEFVKQCYQNDINLQSNDPNTEGVILTPFVMATMGKLTANEKQNCLVSPTTKSLAKKFGIKGLSSGLWGASMVAVKQVQNKLGLDAIKKLGDPNRRGKWYLVATTPQAIAEYEKNLKFNTEFMVGRPL